MKTVLPVGSRASWGPLASGFHAAGSERARVARPGEKRVAALVEGHLGVVAMLAWIGQGLDRAQYARRRAGASLNALATKGAEAVARPVASRPNEDRVAAVVDRHLGRRRV